MERFSILFWLLVFWFSSNVVVLGVLKFFGYSSIAF